MKPIASSKATAFPRRAVAVLCLSLFDLPRADAATGADPTLPSGAQAIDGATRQELKDSLEQLGALERLLQDQERELLETKRALQQQQQRLERLQRLITGDSPRTGSTASEAPQESAAPPSPSSPPSVGQVAPQPEKPPEVAPIFQQPGVLTARGKLVLEPSLEYAYSTTNHVSLIGYTIVPAITIGLIDIRQVNSTTGSGALTARYGLTNRLEIEARLPYVYQDNQTVSRPLNVTSSADSVFDATSQGIGDFEMTGRYQLNEAGADEPYFVGTLRFKSRTGTSPFEVPYAMPFTGASLQAKPPTGSGFYGLQPGLTVLYPSDPAVLFSSINYLHNFERDVGHGFGTIDPGDVFELNFGLGLALNDKTSISFGYDHSLVGKLRQTGAFDASHGLTTSTSEQLGTLLLGLSYRASPKVSWNISAGIGATRNSPDVQLRWRVPVLVN